MAFDEQRLRTAVVQTLRIPEQRYRPNLQLGDLDEWDSVAQLELIAAIEDKYDVELSEEELEKMKVIGDLWKFLEQKTAERLEA